MPRPELSALFDGHGRPSPVALPWFSVDSWVMLPRLHRLENAAALKEEGLGDDAGVRGLACDGCGHVDRLIT